jgi:CMP-N,N'-diacetyllegionaminic acid synthase
MPGLFTEMTMINGKKILAIIPARAGSKRVKNKNIRIFAGKPLIEWSIDSAIGSIYIDHIYVSTDSLEVQKISLQKNVDAIPLREEQLSGDKVPTIDVVLDIIDNKKNGYDIIILLQPTSPLRTSLCIDEAIELFEKRSSDSLVSMSVTDVHPSWCTLVDESLDVKDFIRNLKITRSQDLKEHLKLNGAIYIATTNSIRTEKSLLSQKNCIVYKMEKTESFDIDTEEDLFLAEAVAEKLKRLDGKK